MIAKNKQQKHKITPIGMNAAKAFVQRLIDAPVRGKALTERTGKPFTLVLAYGAEVATASRATHSDGKKDNTAIHQLKWRSIAVVSAMVKNGLADKAELKENPKFDQSIKSIVKAATGATSQEIAALEIVMKNGATLHEVEEFCGVKISHLVEIAKEAMK